MTNYTFANVDKWFSMAEQRMELVAKEALNELLSSTEIVPGRMLGGSPRRGQIPRYTGHLASSLVTELQGGITTSAGSKSYVMGIAHLGIGDSIAFTWTAEYAYTVHYGGSTFPGTYWIDDMAIRWPSAVQRAAAKVKGIFGAN